MSAIRHNQGKTRHDLIPPFAQEQLAKTLTIGGEKYGTHNWCKGMPWSSVIASLERHLQAIKRGEDFDAETGLHHSAHVMCNAAFLTEYYQIHPQGDDRFRHSLKIGVVLNGLLKSDEIPFEPYFYLNIHLDVQKTPVQWSRLPQAPLEYSDATLENLNPMYKDVDVLVTRNRELWKELNKVIFTYLISDNNPNRSHQIISSFDELKR